MSGRRSRQKGKRGERQVVHLFRDAGYNARRGDSQSRGAREADVEDTGFWIEVKIGKRPLIRRAIEQAQRDTDGRPPIVFWRDDRGPWRVDMGADTLLTILDTCGPKAPYVSYRLPEPEEHDGDEGQGQDEDD